MLFNLQSLSYFLITNRTIYFIPPFSTSGWYVGVNLVPLFISHSNLVSEIRFHISRLLSDGLISGCKYSPQKQSRATFKKLFLIKINTYFFNYFNAWQKVSDLSFIVFICLKFDIFFYEFKEDFF